MLLNIDDITVDSAIGGYALTAQISNTTALTLLSVLSVLYDYRRYWTNDLNELDEADIKTIDELLSLANYELTNNAQVSTMLIGSTVLWWSATAPTDYLLCDGTQYAKSAYPDLWLALGNPFEVDASNFVVPDLRDRVPVGHGGAYVINDSGGFSEVTLTRSQMPEHDHQLIDINQKVIGNTVAGAPPGARGYIFTDFLPSGATRFDATPLIVPTGGAGLTNLQLSVGSMGSGNAHNNMQPYLTANYIIKAK